MLIPPKFEAGVECVAPAEGGPSSLFISIPDFPASDKSRFFTIVFAYFADLLDYSMNFWIAASLVPFAFSLILLFFLFNPSILIFSFISLFPV